MCDEDTGWWEVYYRYRVHSRRVLLATPVSTVPSIHLLTMVFDFQPEDLFPDNTTDYTNQEPGFHRHAVDLALFCRGLDYQ